MVLVSERRVWTQQTSNLSRGVDHRLNVGTMKRGIWPVMLMTKEEQVWAAMRFSEILSLVSKILSFGCIWDILVEMPSRHLEIQFRG